MRITISAKKIHNDFARRVEELSGQSLLACYQCGNCTAGCPVGAEMEMAPNQVVRLVQLGQIEVLRLNTIWRCASCFTCAARCPKGVDLSKIMEAMRVMVLRGGLDKLDLSRLRKDLVRRAPQQALVAGSRKLTG